MAEPTTASSSDVQFDQAARSAQGLIDTLKAYKSSLDHLQAVEMELAALSTSVGDAAKASGKLLASSESTATLYKALEKAVAETVNSGQKTLGALEKTAEQVCAKIEAEYRDRAAGGRAAQKVQDDEALAQARKARKAEADESKRHLQAIQSLNAQIELESTGTVEAVQKAASAFSGQVSTSGTEAVRKVQTTIADALGLLDASLGALTTSTETARTSATALTSDVRAAVSDIAAQQKAAITQNRTETTWLLRAAAGAAVLGLLVLLILLARSGQPPPTGIALGEATVQVLNGMSGSGQPFAGPLVSSLRSLGVAGTVMEAENIRGLSAQGYHNTVLLLHGASDEAGLALAAAIGIPSEHVIHGVPVPVNGDLTVVVGDDFSTLTPSVPATE